MNATRPLRALMLTPDAGHLDRRIAQEAATLSSAGWSVDIHPSVDPGLRFDGDLATGARLLSSARPPREPSRLRDALRPTWRRTAETLPPLGRIVETIRYRRRSIAAEIESAALPALRNMGPYDLVVAHDVPVLPLATTLAGAWNAALIADLHEVFPEQPAYFTTPTAKRYWRGLEGDGLRVADAIVCANEGIASYVREVHAPVVPLAVIPNAVPYAARSRLAAGPSIRDVYPIPGDHRVMLFAGSLRAGTGVDRIIEGFAAARLDRWSLGVLGNGPDRADLERQVVSLGLSDRVFLGSRAAERDLIPVLASGDLGIIAYVGRGLNEEVATPNKLFEYVQARLPVASSRLPLVERILRPLGTATFVDFSTASSTADGLVECVRLSSTIADEVLESAARALSWEATEGVYLELVSEALTARKTHSMRRDTT